MIGTVIDQYEITERIGGGGMGEVFRAVDLELERDVAIKCVRPELSDLEEVAVRFRNEARTLAKLAHTNIATVYRFFREDDRLFLVMEYIDGEPFGTRLRKTGALDPEEAVWMTREALHGLGYAHENKVVHRDIKPGNIMIDTNQVVKVLDFGIAHLVEGTRLTRAGSVVGTPAYMAPEQILGKPVDPRTDLYSLGIVLFELLSGNLPYEGNSDFELMRSHVEDVPRSLDELTNGKIPQALQLTVRRALNKDATERFQTAAEFDDALRRCIPAASPTRRRNTMILPDPEAAESAGNKTAEGGKRTLQLPDLNATQTQIGLGVAAALLVVAGAYAFLGSGSDNIENDQAQQRPTISSVQQAPAGQVVSPFGGGSGPIVEHGSTTPERQTQGNPVTTPPSQPVAINPGHEPADLLKPTVQSEPIQSNQTLERQAPRAVPGGRVRAVKVATHERQGTGRFSRNAGYNGAFALSGISGTVQIDEIADVYQNGRRVMHQLVHSEKRRAGTFKSKQRIVGLKDLQPGDYELVLRFERSGHTIGTHRWKLEVTD